MTISFKSMKHKLIKSTGQFELLGFDFLVDQDFNVS